MNTSGTWTSRRAQVLKPVLAKWVKLVERYAEQQKGDLAYWYNERPTLSVLAAAAWMAGGIALEEFSSPKFNEGGEEPASGRADLWLRFKNLELAIEAKQAWLTHAAAQKGRLIKRRLEAACEDAVALPADAAHLLAGVVLAVPDLAPRYQDEFDPEVFVRQMRQAKHDFAAWTLSPPPWPESPITAYKYPGVVLLGRLVAKRHGRTRK